MSQWIHKVLSGEAKGSGAALVRGTAGLVEPVYAALMRARNALYDRGTLSAYRLPRPVVSIGNITAGGTGKTPVVRWLAGRLREEGIRPAILMRGYRSGPEGPGDEQEMLEQCLNGEGQTPVVVHADPDRIEGGGWVIDHHPKTGVFLLDDGFQHRRLGRDFDLVLIDASNPFGYGYVHPRGLLREPLDGLRRASAFLISRSDLVSAQERVRIEAELRRYGEAPIYHARHRLAGMRTMGMECWRAPDLKLEELGGKKFFAFAGIANPAALERQLKALGETFAGAHWFEDHHPYGKRDLELLDRLARQAGAEVMVTTEKDWVKLQQVKGVYEQRLPIWRLELAIEFEGEEEGKLLGEVMEKVRGFRLE